MTIHVRMLDRLKRRITNWSFSVVSLGFCTALLTVGCTTTEPMEGASSGDGLETVGSRQNNTPAGTGEWFTAKEDFVPFFTLGPQQASGPDLNLRSGELVELVRRGFGFSQVRIPDGRVGYVSTASLQPAEPPAPEPAPEAPVSAAITRVYRSEPSTSSPPPDLPPLPDLAPLPDAEDLPAFRY